MRRVLVSVEGQTEDVLVRTVLQPHLWNVGVHVQPRILQTKRPKGSDPAVKGGISSWEQAKRDVRRLLGDTGAACVTTMYDFYAFPKDAPGMGDRHRHADPRERVADVEAAMAEEFGDRRFHPYLCLHETEALVLAAPQALREKAAADPHADVATLGKFGEPELVNEDDPPSKRLLASWKRYAKPIDGPAIIDAAGIDAVRSACPHFDAWLARLEKLGE